jgi:hypothetical protein
MEATIAAVFQSRIGARDAISDLCRTGLHASDVSVAEAVVGEGTIFGTAQTLAPGRGSSDIGTFLQPQYPRSARGGMPGGLTAVTPDDVLANVMDFGLSEEAAGEAQTALGAGAVLLAVTVGETVAKASMDVLERNGGTVIEAPGSFDTPLS